MWNLNDFKEIVQKKIHRYFAHDDTYKLITVQIEYLVFIEKEKRQVYHNWKKKKRGQRLITRKKLFNP